MKAKIPLILLICQLTLEGKGHHDQSIDNKNMYIYNNIILFYFTLIENILSSLFASELLSL